MMINIDEVLSSQQHKDFIKGVVNEYSSISARRTRGMRKAVYIPVVVLYKLSNKPDTGVIRCLKSRRSTRESYNWLDAHITIDGKSSIYEVPLCQNNEVLDKAGLHSDGYVFCITSSDYASEIEERQSELDFHYIRQMVSEVHSRDFSSIEHITGLMMEYVKRYK